MRPSNERRSVVLITGASSGIGRATAHLLAAAGHGLVLSSRSAAVLAEVAAECRGAGANAADVLAVTADVRDPKAVAHLFAVAVERFGRIDKVVHCAGAMTYGRFGDVPAEVFEATLDTNLGGTTRVARHALEQFRSQRAGHLVVIGSVLGKIAAPKVSAYVTSKWAIHGLVRSLQLELRDEPGIDVTLISPGGVDTPIYRLAGTYAGRHGSPPPPVASSAGVAEVIAGVLDRPAREVPVGRVLGLAVLGFRALPGTFDALVGPLFSRLAQGRQTDVAPTAGNVLRPTPDGEALTGGYGRWGIEPKAEDPTMDDQQTAPAGHGREPGPTITRRVAAPAAAVWSVLCDGWSYATWVVGASRVRDVDAGWPAVGTCVHHSFGLWPLVIQDVTKVEALTPKRELILTARGWPVGEARVHLSVREDGPETSVVTITEDAVAGPGRLVPPPARHLLLAPRNRETLHRLALLAEGRHREAGRRP